jgi:Asp-tRNA(Asn)/Glu-tRNA(Gln) amidotransferase A subunit family amidase
MTRRLPIVATVALGVLLGLHPSTAAAQDLPALEKLDAPTAIEMMAAGKLTSVRLTKAYIARIEALNKRGPGLNAVTQLNEDALKEAAQFD